MEIDIKQIPDFSHYEYYRYIVGGDDPDFGIRVLIDKDGYARRAETMNPETGEFRNSTGLLSEIRERLCVEDSDEDEFNRLNAAQMEWKKKQKIQPLEGPS